MLLIVEIVLTVLVWKHGYKWKALIPIAWVFLSGLTLGIVLEVMELEISRYSFILLDVICVIALIIMLNKKAPEEKKPSSTNP